MNEKVKELVSRGLHDKTIRLYCERLRLHPMSSSSSSSSSLGVEEGASILPSVVKACSSSNRYSSGLQLHGMIIKSSLYHVPVISNSLVSMYAKFFEPDDALKVFDTMPLRDAVSWNAIINCHVQNGDYGGALRLFKEMHACGFPLKSELAASVVSVCAEMENMRLGRMVHAIVVVDARVGESLLLSTSIVDLYFKSGVSSMAFRVFDRIEVKNEVAWTAVIGGCASSSRHHAAVGCFRSMQADGFKPNRVTLIAMLPACGGLGGIRNWKEIHGYAIRHGFDSDRRLSSRLISLYGTGGGGALAKQAKLIFQRSRVKDVVLWSAIIGCHSRGGDGSEAIELFKQMLEDGGERPNPITLLAVLTACTTLASLHHGSCAHGQVVKRGLLARHLSIGNALMNMYSKCGCLASSRQLFDETQGKDNVSWTTLINGYGLHGDGEEALSLFREMRRRGIELDAISLLAVLSACNHSGLIKEGCEIFDDAARDGRIPLGVEHRACHAQLLAKMGKMEETFSILRTMPINGRIRTWTSVVSACKNQLIASTRNTL